MSDVSESTARARRAGIPPLNTKRNQRARFIGYSGPLGTNGERLPRNLPKKNGVPINIPRPKKPNNNTVRRRLNKEKLNKSKRVTAKGVKTLGNLEKELFVSISFPSKNLTPQSGVELDTASSEENVKIEGDEQNGKFKVLLLSKIPFLIPAPPREETTHISSTKLPVPKRYTVTSENIEKVTSNRIEHQYIRREGQYMVPWFNLSYEADIYKLKTGDPVDGDHYFFYFLNMPKANYIMQIDQDFIAV